ncbi:CMRF35-like molecule 1 isoform X2 [Sturnira hondurensis]|uniref:CMRF35-like molecule 1 isoform X2 n=1 Tax=Sturnira hondurensis TaxID=192404 RepID=UPI00187A2B46|nr:CMRF35-like molecule 1 isoform X2 [Sturnira hondurensis]
MHLLLLLPLLFRLSGSSDPSADITGPEEVRGPERGSLTMQCHYVPGWEPYEKYWCRGTHFRNCGILVRTTGSEQEVKEDRVSIRDNWKSLQFTVTMKKLRREDAGTYWCGIEKNESDPRVPVKVTVGPGSAADITGPEEVSGPEHGSLTVQCHYVPGWEPYVKYWCRGAEWSNCNIFVRTTGSEWGVKEDRVSISDNQTNRTFTVTMEKLRREDADTYWCGIERTGSDPGIPVKVAVVPATTVSTTTPITTTFTVPVSTEGPTSSLNVSLLHPDGRGVFAELNILLPLLSALLLLLLVAASLLVWRIMKRRRKGLGTGEPQDELSNSDYPCLLAAGMSPEQVLQPPESDICYANLTLKQPGSTPSSTRKRAPAKHSSFAQEGRQEVEYITMASFPKEDISYAALSLDGLDQDATYVNTGDIVTHLPSRGHEELTEYSTIVKP